jgi:hypothetical protein
MDPVDSEKAKLHPMTRFEKADRLAAVIFRRLPGTTSRQAQTAHRTAKEIAADVLDELERIERIEASCS